MMKIKKLLLTNSRKKNTWRQKIDGRGRQYINKIYTNQMSEPLRQVQTDRTERKNMPYTKQGIHSGTLQQPPFSNRYLLTYWYKLTKLKVSELNIQQVYRILLYKNKILKKNKTLPRVLATFC